MRKTGKLMAIVLIFSLASCTIVMNRKFANKSEFRPINGTDWEVGIPVYVALSSNVDKAIWDYQNFMIYIPFNWVGGKIDNWCLHFFDEVESRYIRLDSVITVLLPSDSLITRHPPPRPYKQDSTEYVLDIYQNYHKSGGAHPCLVFDTLTIPAEIDSIRSEFILHVGSVSKKYQFILYRKEGKKLGINAI